jgi:hypothetical protein
MRSLGAMAALHSARDYGQVAAGCDLEVFVNQFFKDQFYSLISIIVVIVVVLVLVYGR